MSLDRDIERWMEKNNVAGLAACIAYEDRIVWSNGYGWANIAKKIPFTADETLFQIASITKTFTAVAIMQLRDKGLFALDDDVNKFLKFSLRNPRHPDKPITFRHLLTHTSSIDDDDCIYSLYALAIPTGRLKMSLSNISRLVAHYGETAIFSKMPPAKRRVIPILVLPCLAILSR